MNAPPPLEQQRKERRRALRGKVTCGVLIAVTAAYLVVLVTIAAANRQGAERAWWSTANLYLPQILWTIPGILLTLLTLLLVRGKMRLRATLAQLVPVLWVIGPLMGFTWPVGASAGKGTPLRVMTYNIERGKGGLDALFQNISAAHPDLLICQDANDAAFERRLRARYPAWHIAATGEHLIGSRFPLVGEPRRESFTPIDKPWEGSGYTRYVLQTEGAKITVYDVHLMTPREPLLALRSRDKQALPTLANNVNTRLSAAARLAKDVRGETGPVLVAGDFNAPVVSLVCRPLFSAGLHNAFSRAGRGYGYTYGHDFKPHYSFMRIDHIFVNASWQVVGCETGAENASDHRPVIADLRLHP